MQNALTELYQVVLDRKQGGSGSQSSYTCYLFEQGLDKILKKCGEECAEVIIAAKNGRNEDTVNELCDLLYHLTVLMASQGIELDEVYTELSRRSQKIGNLKKINKTDKNS